MDISNELSSTTSIFHHFNALTATDYEMNPDNYILNTCLPVNVSPQSSQLNLELTVQEQKQELLELLKVWKQEELLEVLADQGVFVNILKIVKPHHISKILQTCNMGTQILFEHNLENWRLSIGNSINSTLDCSRTLAIPDYSSPNSPSGSSVGSISSDSEFIHLTAILNENPKGAHICEYYEKASKLNEDQRNTLINMIASAYEQKDVHMSLKMSHKLEKEILVRFPTEKLEYYRTSTRGKLYNRVANTKKTFKSKFPSIPDAKNKPAVKKPKDSLRLFTNELVPETEAEACIKSLKFDKLNSEEFDSIWKACSNYRITDIHTLKSTHDILEKWPYYRKPSGYRLIDMDFRVMYSSKGNCLLDKWDDFKGKLELFLKTNVKDKFVKGVMSHLKEEASISNGFDSRDAIILWALHAYLYPTKTLVKKDANGKKTMVKFTIRDSQDSFLFAAKCHQQIEDHIAHLKSLQNSIQPRLLAVGDDIHKLKEVYVYFDDIKFSFTNFIRAVDICFKVFFLFNLDFPTECSTFWTFIQTFFYEIPSEEAHSKVHLLTQELLNEMAHN